MMTVNIYSFPDLCQELRDRSPCPVVGVDGFYGAGKTSLARGIARRLNVLHIEIDGYLDRDVPGSYLDNIRFAGSHGLTRHFRTWRRDGTPLVLDGVQLQEVLARLLEQAHFPPPPPLLIYTKRLSGNTGHWHDGDTLEDFMRKLPEPPRPLPPACDYWSVRLERSVLNYHVQFRSHESSHVIYHNRRSTPIS